MERSDLPFESGSSALMKARAAAGGLALPGGSVKGLKLEPKDESPQMAAFKRNLREVAAVTTVGIRTLSCMSPRNLALEQVAGQIGYLPTPEEQVVALDMVFSESDKLYPDQNAHVMAKVVQDLITPDRVTLHDRAMSRVGQRILKAGLKIAPDLLSESMVNDSYAQDLLKAHMNALVEYPYFGFSSGVKSMMEEVGLMEPMTDEKFRSWDDSPECLANWLRNEINGVLERQIEPDDYALLLDHTVTLPDDLRGRTLAHLANTFTNSLQLESNEHMVMEIASLINQLPLQIRITPLEAFHNQLTQLPNDRARAFFPVVQQAVQRIPDTSDFRFNRSRRDLVNDLGEQGQALEMVNFMPNESLYEAQQRYSEMQEGGAYEEE